MVHILWSDLQSNTADTFMFFVSSHSFPVSDQAARVTGVKQRGDGPT